MKKRDKRKGIFLIIGLIVLISLIFIGLKFTGYVLIEDSDLVQVFRLVETNAENSLVEVTLQIVSAENVLAIQENLAEGCSVLDYSIGPDIGVFEFKESENTWVLANRSDNLNAKLVYTLGIIEEGNNWCEGADITKDGIVDGADLSLLSSSWLKDGCGEINNWCEGADITKDGIVDGADLSLLSSRWLRDDCSGSTETSSDCTNISGKYFIVSESVPISENSWCNGADVNRDGSVDPGDSDDLMFWRTFEGNPCSLSNSLCNNNVDINKDGLVDDIDDELMMAEFGRDDCSETVISATETSTPDISSTTSSSSSLDTSSSSSLTETELASNEIIEVESQEELDGFVKNAIEKIMGEEIEGDLKSKSVVLLTVLVLVAIGIIIFFSVSFLRKPKR